LQCPCDLTAATQHCAEQNRFGARWTVIAPPQRKAQLEGIVAALRPELTRRISARFAADALFGRGSILHPAVASSQSPVTHPIAPVRRSSPAAAHRAPPEARLGSSAPASRL
jgi:hypothetical protein